MPAASTAERTTVDTLSADQIEFYRTNGFVKVSGIIAPEEAATYREAALAISDAGGSIADGSVFDQHVNVWRDHESIRGLTLHPNVAAIAQKLAGVPMRLWHDHILIKRPHNNAATEFHQDQPYWPHADSPNPISCWIALCDVPVERGCMTFLPGSHERTDLQAQNLRDDQSLFSICEDLRWSQRVTIPLKAGDCTFHHGRCAHMATPNFTDQPRVAHVIIYMDATTTYDGKGHVVTDPTDFAKGDVLEGEMFPTVGEIVGA